MRLRGFRLKYIWPFEGAIVERFLNSFEGLEYLQIDVEEMTGPPSLDCLAKHAATLKRLHWGINDFDDGPQFYYSADQINKVIEDCPKLKHFAIELPEMTVHVPQVGQALPDFDQSFMRAFRHAGHLQYLSILNWPVIGGQRTPCNCDAALQAAYSERIDRLADNLVAGLMRDMITSLSRLRLLCIGASNQTSYADTPDREVHEDPCIMMPLQCYVPGRAADGSEDLASRVNWRAVRYEHCTYDMFPDYQDGIDVGFGLPDLLHV
ncbi:hypothetical protein LTR86_000574 [Recurvomyces mirabilis]|nr:hypothetical protein LTR86_000574 [Recurvomyces mirabilis]